MIAYAKNVSGSGSLSARTIAIGSPEISRTFSRAMIGCA